MYHIYIVNRRYIYINKVICDTDSTTRSIRDKVGQYRFFSRICQFCSGKYWCSGFYLDFTYVSTIK